MNELLLIIDLQNDFINEKTKHIVEKIENLVEQEKYTYIVFTRYINSYDNLCYTKLNFEGCLTENGKKIAIDSKNYKVIDKPMYTSLVPELEEYIKENKIEKIYLCGVDTECCVLKTALDLFDNGYNVYVLKDYCASMEGNQAHNNAIELLERNIGNNYVI